LQNWLQLSIGRQLEVWQMSIEPLGQRTEYGHAAAVAERVVAEWAASRATASNRTLDSVRIIDSSSRLGFYGSIGALAGGGRRRGFLSGGDVPPRRPRGLPGGVVDGLGRLYKEASTSRDSCRADPYLFMSASAAAADDPAVAEHAAIVERAAVGDRAAENRVVGAVHRRRARGRRCGVSRGGIGGDQGGGEQQDSRQRADHRLLLGKWVSTGPSGFTDK
jgi:hypothetical protein